MASFLVQAQKEKPQCQMDDEAERGFYTWPFYVDGSVIRQGQPFGNWKTGDKNNLEQTANDTRIAVS